MKRINNPFEKYYTYIKEKVFVLYKINDVYLGDDGFFYVVDKLTPLYKDKKQALLQTVIYRLQRGVPFSNYKNSKYYSYYYEKIKKSHPEYCI